MSVQKLLGVDSEEVASCLTSLVTVTRGEYVKRAYSVHQAQGEFIWFKHDFILDRVGFNTKDKRLGTTQQVMLSLY